MKAGVRYEAGKPLSVEEINIDPAQQGEVKEVYLPYYDAKTTQSILW